ncbi:ATP-dependent helicase [Candidatus Fermentibacteria bacterium]|nr:MAG: ATP-dependent helicase [Candidatus Fermentibacteria bacterium]
MPYASGSLVKARGREWVVQLDSGERILLLKPLGGTDEEITGICLDLEKVEEASFRPPEKTQLGDYRSARLLRNAVKLGFRNSAGPFRCFGSIAVEPRPYQLVPLLMALKLDPIRMLISDDVGIGKTIEACLIVKELLARGEITGFSVLCPAQLAEQWQKELKEKFHIDSELVLPGTVKRLEKNLTMGQSLFEKYPVTVVSLDFIKSDRHRSDFIRACPKTVIIDEAHSCASKGTRRHQRYNLVKELSQDESRNMLFVTATPHSGNEDAFRSLLTLLKPEFSGLPPVLTGKENEQHRRNLAKHFVQRTRGDITAYLNEETSFPAREDKEEPYLLSEKYKKLFDDVISYTRESISKKQIDHRGRIRYWSALALLRALASSPSAAAATLKNRAAVADTETAEEADEIGRRTILDLDLDTMEEAPDIIPGSKTGENEKKLISLARQAEAIEPEDDLKLQKAIKLVKKHMKEGYYPIVFCRFIDTAEYLAANLRSKIKKANIECVTGKLPHEERERIVEELSSMENRVLVCTDCLSEGINLQEGFNSVIHYDLSWNPMRHEQRAGRVDRYGQKSGTVRVTNYYGEDNGIDQRVMKVLLKKHTSIRNSLGISVPIPGSTSEIMEALIEDLFQSSSQMVLSGFEDFMAKTGNEIFRRWDRAEEREKQSRTMFRQMTIKVDEVARELQEAREATGSGISIEQFVTDAVRFHDGVVTETKGTVTLDLKDSPEPLADALELPDTNRVKRVTYSYPPKADEEYLTRTHPFIENLAAYIVDSTMDEETDSRTGRCGVIRTNQIQKKTTLILTRTRYHIDNLLTEDTELFAFTGKPSNPALLTQDEAKELLTMKPTAQMNPDIAWANIERITGETETLMKHLTAHAEQRGEEILRSHTRVRQATRQKKQPKIKLQKPVDILGIYVFLPTPGGVSNA